MKRRLLETSLLFLLASLCYQLLRVLGLGYWIPARWSKAVIFIGMIAFSLVVACVLLMAIDRILRRSSRRFAP